MATILPSSGTWSISCRERPPVPMKPRITRSLAPGRPGAPRTPEEITNGAANETLARLCRKRRRETPGEGNAVKHFFVRSSAFMRSSSLAGRLKAELRTIERPFLLRRNASQRCREQRHWLCQWHVSKWICQSNNLLTGSLKWGLGTD